MKRPLVMAVATLVLCGCDNAGDQSGGAEEGRLRMVVADSPIILEAGESIVLQLLVIGAGATEAEISSPGLPPFAVLHGSRLRLSPGRSYEGDYSLTFIAKAGSSTASAVLQVTVTRRNTAPSLIGNSPMLGNDRGIYGSLDMLPTLLWPRREVPGTAAIDVVLGDAEGDAVTVDAEIVLKGQPFSGVPTHSVTAPVGVDSDPTQHCHAAYDAFHACIQLPFPRLAVGQTYSFALRIRDQLGATATFPGSDKLGDGWWTSTYWWFAQGP